MNVLQALPKVAAICKAQAVGVLQGAEVHGPGISPWALEELLKPVGVVVEASLSQIGVGHRGIQPAREAQWVGPLLFVGPGPHDHLRPVGGGSGGFRVPRGL